MILEIAKTSIKVRAQLPFSTKLTAGVNPSGERQTEIDVFANDAFASALLATGTVAEIASEEMEETRKGQGGIHVAMDPLDGSSNISTNNPLGSIFGFYFSPLPCSGRFLMGAAFVTYGPMLTITFSTGGGVATFVATEEEKEGGGTRTEFTLLENNVVIPPKPEVYGFGGQRRDWILPVERFAATLESRGMKLRYGGTFVGDFNQVLRYGGIFGYPALKSKPKGKLRILYEAAPMAFITNRCGGYATDGLQDALQVEPASLEDTTPIYLGSKDLVAELEALVHRTQ